MEPERRVLRVRLAAEPSSVPSARRFVTDGLRAWGRDTVVDDAALCVSELAGNAALHDSCTYIEVCVVDLPQVVRVWVEDDGSTPVAALRPRVPAPEHDTGPDPVAELDALLHAPSTGRGLAIVSVLASDWGIEALDHGKRVWADLPLTGEAAEVAEEPHLVPARPGPVSTRAGDHLPEGWAVARLTGCPVDLAVRHNEHLDELVRELTLMSTDEDRSGSAKLVRRLEAILQTPAQARRAVRRQTEAALARGDGLVDLEVAMPEDFAAQAELLNQAIDEADRLCDEERLLTLTSPQILRAFRAWMTEEIIAQVDLGRAPITWAAWRAGRRRAAH